MKTEEFEELMESLKEAKVIIAQEKTKRRPAAKSDVAFVDIRKNLHLSQEQFASFIGVKPSTLRNWEQGRAKVPAPALTLYKVVRKFPQVVAKVR